MLFDVTATGGGEELEVRTNARDILTWEREHDESFLSGGTTFGQLAELTWLAFTRTGKTSLSFDDFVDTLEGISTKDVSVGPTKKARSAKRSRASS
jgi:hypothetical protein